MPVRCAPHPCAAYTATLTLALARVACGSCHAQDADGELRQFTPAFLWLLRDFYLRLEDEAGAQVGPTFESAVWEAKAASFICSSAAAS